MSTFGKKSLLKWDYDSVDYLRWNKTHKDLQLEILKKWYPIGEYFYFILLLIVIKKKRV